MYDKKEIKAIVSKKKKSFIIMLSLALLALILGIVFLVLDLNNTMFFSGILIILFSLIFIYVLCNKYSPAILFSREIKGENIKEHIYEVYVRRGIALRPRQVGMGYGGQPLSHTRMAKASLRSAVYLRLDDGSIKEIRNMRVEHIELYEDGDLLLKYAGTKYPVITNRESERQPCPICGTINLKKDGACITCKLTI